MLQEYYSKDSHIAFPSHGTKFAFIEEQYCFDCLKLGCLLCPDARHTRGSIARASGMVRYRLETWAPWKRFLLVMLYGLLLLSLLCAHQEESAEAQGLPPVKIPSSVASDDGQWRMAPKDYANLRYSALDQITPENIKNLHVAFTFSTGVTQGHEAAPLVVNNTMYLVTPYPNFVFALDLTKPGAPVKWQYDPKSPAAARGV